MEAGFKYYVTVGSAVHDVVQTLLAGLDLEPIKVSVIADWKCRRCFHRSVMVSKPEKCRCGHTDFKFEECTVDDGGVLGHIDTILEITLSKATPEFPEAKFWLVVDYKTSSLKKTTLQKGVPNQKMVSSSNRSQIRAYVTLLKKMGKPVAPFAALIYIPRDNPFEFKVHVLEVDFTKERRLIGSYKRQFKMAVHAKTKADLVEMVEERPCSEKCLKQFEWCKWRNMCAGPDNAKVILRELDNIRRVVDARLPIIDWKPVAAPNTTRQQDELV